MPSASQGARTTNRTIAGLILLTLGLSGCAATRAASVPPRAATPAPKRVVAYANPQLDGVVGRMLAVDTLLKQVDSLLQSGYSAQTVQLPESATANFADARGHLNEAVRVFFMLGTAGPYQRIADNFGHAIALYSAAAGDGASRSDQSQHEAASARDFLTRAETTLNAAPEASQTSALAAESAALSAVAPRPAPHPSTVARTVRHLHSRHVSRPQYVPQPHFAPRPASTPVLAVRGTLGGYGSRPPARRPTTVRVVIPTATPAPTLAPTPRPTSAPVTRPAPSVRPVHHAHHAVNQRLLAALRLVAGQRSGLGHALRAVKVCRSAVASVAAGTDPAGSAALDACLNRSLDALTAVHPGKASSPSALATQRPSIASVRGEVALAQSELQKARTDLQAIDLPATQTDLDAAFTALHRARGTLLSIERALRHQR